MTKWNFQNKIMLKITWIFSLFYSGGIGRSGTFLTAYGVYSHFKNKSILEDEELSKPICLVETVKNMRLQRHPWMVEGLKQYEMAYNISLHLLLEMSQ